MPEVLVLRGRSALSPFRVAKLLAALAAVRPRHAITHVAARFWHFVEIARPLVDAERETLDRLLAYGPVDPVDGGASDVDLLVVPRFGTISPWSSKATDIARNCALDVVTRVERGVAFDIVVGGRGNLREDERAALLPLIHDRMTETVVGDIGDARRLFTHFPPRPLATIPLQAKGRRALEEADATLGLALAPDEIDYLVDAFTRLGRDPTDVELTMFAQADSVPSRPKDFNAAVRTECGLHSLDSSQL